MNGVKLILLMFFCTAINAFAQTTFQKTYGGTGADEGRCVLQTNDGGYIIECQTDNFGPGSSNLYLIKTNSVGTATWTKTYGGSVDNFGYSLDLTNDGGYILAGGTNSFRAGGYDFYLVKTNSIGDTLWTKTIGSAGDDYSYAVQATADSGFIAVGVTTSFGAGGMDIYLIKTNPNGDTLWTKTFGGSGDDVAFAVRQTSDGGYILTGYTTSFGISSDNIYLIKTDANGGLLWSKTYGGTGSERGFSVQQTADSGYIVTGYTTSFGSGNTTYLLKLDSLGSLIWSKTYSGSGSYGGNSVQPTSDGGYIITGNTTAFGAGASDVYLLKTDANGDTLWAMAYGSTSPEIGFSVQQTTDGGYAIAGTTRSFGAGNEDVFLIKTDANGKSGCNSIKATPLITSPATQVTSPLTISASYSAVVSYVASDISGGGAESTVCLALGFNETLLSNNTISVFPNPSTDRLTIKNGQLIMSGRQLSIYNVLGEKVLSQNVLMGIEAVINVSPLLPGIYFGRINGPSGEAEHYFKFIKN